MRVVKYKHERGHLFPVERTNIKITGFGFIVGKKTFVIRAGKHGSTSAVASILLLELAKFDYLSDTLLMHYQLTINITKKLNNHKSHEFMLLIITCWIKKIDH